MLDNPLADNITGTEGTRQFCSPECLGLTDEGPFYSGKASDIWSLGVCLYVYIYQRLPFNAIIEKNPKEGVHQDGALISLFNTIKEGKLTFYPERVISEELQDLLMKLLKTKASERIKIEKLKKHPWIHGKTMD